MNIKSRIIKIVKKIHPRFGLKESDIILATFPKSGTTWFRFIYANLISLLELDGKKVDYELLNNELNSAFDAHIYPKIKYKRLPRLVATHQIYDARKFGQNRKLFLYRNPLDTMVSYWEYYKGSVNYKDDYTFNSFIRDPKYGIEAWIKHYLKWKSVADFCITYEELKEDDIRIVEEVLSFFSLNTIDKKIIKDAVERSRFNKIRKMEEENGLDRRAKKTLKETFRFARKGQTGEWKENFCNDDLIYSNKLFRKYELYNFIVK